MLSNSGILKYVGTAHAWLKQFFYVESFSRASARFTFLQFFYVNVLCKRVTICFIMHKFVYIKWIYVTHLSFFKFLKLYVHRQTFDFGILSWRAEMEGTQYLCTCYIVKKLITNYSQQDATFLEFNSTDALHVSGGYSAHHREHITVHTASRIVNQYCW